MSGRRTRGFVTAIFDAAGSRKLLPIDGMSGLIPSFDDVTLESLRWAATHYVAPLSVLLKRTLPPNIPKLPQIETAPWKGKKPTRLSGDPPRYRVGAPPYGPAVAETIGESVAKLRNIVVIAPSVLEVDVIASQLEREYPDRVVVATSSMAPKAVTASWARVATGVGTILVGTREVMFWPFGDVGLVVVVEDGRRVMRSQRAPTVSVREVVLRRSKSEGFDVVFFGPVPTLETIAHRVNVEYPSGRQWPIVEVVDRGEDPPGGGVLSERAKAALRRSTAIGDRTFVLVGSRAYAPAFRCVGCGDLRRCAACGSAASRQNDCRRCGELFGSCPHCGGRRFQPLGAGIGRLLEDIRRVIGDQVGQAGDDKAVTVGSERDLIGVSGMGLALAVDVDGLTMAPHYRAAEDALRLLVRLAHTVRRGGGHRCLIQTALPNQEVVRTLVDGRSGPFLRAELGGRKRFGFPPIGELIAIETEGGDAEEELLLKEIRPLATLMGPAQERNRTRWLLQGRNLDDARVALRPVINTLRARGARVRVDVDPIDL